MAALLDLAAFCHQFDTCFIKICSVEADLRAFEDELPCKYFLIRHNYSMQMSLYNIALTEQKVVARGPVWNGNQALLTSILASETITPMALWLLQAVQLLYEDGKASVRVGD